MRVLQIANDYLNPLFEKMFCAIENKGVKNKVVVPIKKGGIVDPNWNKDVKVLECFNQIDRFFFFLKQSKVKKAINSCLDINDYEIIHAHTLFSAGYTAMKLSKEFNIPYVVAVRNTDVNTFFKYMPYLRNTGVSILKYASAIVFLSPAYKNMVIEKYVPNDYKQLIQEKSFVIPNGISEVFFSNIGHPKKYINNDELNLLYVGEITVNKNLNTIIEVARKLNKKIKTKVVIVGNIVDSQCKELLDDILVEYHSRCNQKQLIEYYRNADIFIMPSHKETFGLVYAEAMSQGVPIIYTKGQGFDGYFEDGMVGYAVNDCDSDDIVNKINKILLNYNDISKNCITFCGKFSWFEIADSYCSLYNEIII